MRRIMCFCLIVAVFFTTCGLTACHPDAEKTKETTDLKEPGMYFLGKFTPWERLETTGDLWVEDGTLSAEVPDESEEQAHSDRIGGTIILPEGVKAIGKYVFAGCRHIEKVIIPKTVRNIGAHAFSKCTQLQELAIPDDVTQIGRGAFDGVGNISYKGALIYTPDDLYWGADSMNQEGKTQEETFETEVDGVHYTYKKFDRKENAVVITKMINVGRDLVIPAKLNGFDVYGIGCGEPAIFGYDKSVKKEELGNSDNLVPVLDSITLEEGIKGIGSYAFQRIYLKRLSLPQSLEFINDSAFEENKFLRKLTIKGNHVNIGEDAFARSGISELQLPVMDDMENQLGSMAFSGNSQLKRVTFAEGTREISISRECFGDCPNVQIIIGRGVKTFSSDINTVSGKVRLLDKETEVIFSKIAKAKEGAERGYYVDVEEPEGERFRYRTSYEEFIVPEGFEQVDDLNKAYYIVYVDDEEVPGERDKDKEYYYTPYCLLKKVQYRVEG